MPATATMIPARDVASLMNWWREAGVDTVVDEVPTPWLARNSAPVPVPHADVKPVAEALPGTREAFARWWMESADIPGGGPANRRVAPMGGADSGIMVLIDLPEPGDVEAGKLIAGEVGALFDNMLSAIKFDRSQILMSALAPSRIPSGRIAREDEKRLGEIALHHIGLVAPKRLWIVGEAASRAILGMELQSARGRKHILNHSGGTVEAVASLHPRLLVNNAQRKKLAWADMQLLIEGL